jgi:diguanylate cyclase
MPRWARTAALGLLFGFATIIAILSPMVVTADVQVNGRSIILAFAAAFGGLVPFAIAAAIALLGQAVIGLDTLVGAILPPALAGVVGSVWRARVFPRRGYAPGSLLALGVLAASGSFLVLLVPGDGIQLFLHIFPPTLASALMAALVLGSFIQRETRHLAQERLWQSEALTDPLTGIANKRAFQLESRLFEASAKEATLMMFDIDHFKKINDTMGHPAGDEVLRQVTNVISSVLGSEAHFYRYGGEEFAVTLQSCQRCDAEWVGERVRAAIEQSKFVVDGQQIAVTVSVGIADTNETATISDVLRSADAALYRAKTSGRNCVVSAWNGVTLVAA